MINSLDNSLEELLRHTLPPSMVDQVAISFDTPDEKFPPQHVQLPAINLFLYDMRENRELRNNEWMLERSGSGPVTRKPAPVRVDCSYLVTAWTSESSNTRAKEEHHLLGEVMKVLLRFPTIPAEVLQGDLKGQAPPLPAITLHEGRLQSPGEFWQALGGKPKAAFHYTVTIGLEVEKAVDLGPPVTDKLLKFRQGTGED